MAEFYFRMFNPHENVKSEQNIFFEYNNTLGWQLIPNKSGVVSSKHEYKTVVTINNAGMRDRDRQVIKTTGEKRIAVLGDSFTAGMDVDDQDVFTQILENNLLKNAEVLNFGVNGYGPTQEYLLLKSRALRYKPDIVVMIIYMGNDFDDIVGLSDWIDGYKRPQAVLNKRDRIDLTNIPVPRTEGHNLKRKEHACNLPQSHFINFLDKYLHELKKNKYAIENMPSELRICKKNPDEQTIGAFNLMRGIINETNSLCKKNGCRFTVVAAPTIIQVYNNVFWPKIVKKYNLNTDTYDLETPNKVLAKMCDTLNIPFLDLTTALKEAARKGDDVYYYDNQHWNRKGHQVVAETISKFIESNHLL
jgi:lysophospholipase L1-like esterase